MEDPREQQRHQEALESFRKARAAMSPHQRRANDEMWERICNLSNRLVEARAQRIEERTKR